MIETCGATHQARGRDAQQSGVDETIFALPAGWQLHHRTGPLRTSIEIHEPRGDLIGLVASTNLPIVSVDAGWRAFDRDSRGGVRWWALAIGHGLSMPAASVTFSRRSSHSRVHRVDVTPLMVDGLWVAAAAGRYSKVTFRQGDDEDIRRLQLQSEGSSDHEPLQSRP